jgi:hypothetical protein
VFLLFVQEIVAPFVLQFHSVYPLFTVHFPVTSLGLVLVSGVYITFVI